MLVKEETRHDASYLHLCDGFLMLYDRRVLNEVEGVHLTVSRIVKFIFRDFPHNVSSHPFSRIFHGDLVFDVFEIRLGHADFDENAARFDHSLLADVENIAMLHLIVNTLGDALNHFAHLDLFELQAGILDHIDESRLDHEQEHRKNEEEIDENFDDEPVNSRSGHDSRVCL